MALLENTVPPIDLNKISIFAQSMSSNNAQVDYLVFVLPFFYLDFETFQRPPTPVLARPGGKAKHDQSSRVLWPIQVSKTRFESGYHLNLDSLA